MSDVPAREPVGARHRWSEVSTAAASLLVVATGVAVLIGWRLESMVLLRVVELPGSRAMMPLTAVSFVLSGLALGLLRTGHRAAPRAGRIGGALAVALVALNLVFLVEYVAGVDPGIDRVLFPVEIQRYVDSAPGRPAPTASAAFVAVGVALLLLDATAARWVVLAQLLACIAGFLGTQGLAGYGYGTGHAVPAPGEAVVLLRMAIHTAAAFVVLAFGILVARPERGVMPIFLGRDPGALIARRLLPAAILVPLILGWLRVAGEEAGLYGPATGTALFAAANMVVFTVLIGWNAALARRLDVVRRRAETARRASEARYRTLVETANEGIWVVDRAGATKFVNGRMLEMLGSAADEIAERPLQDFVAPEARAAVEGLLSETTAAVRELRLRRRDGEDLWVLMSTSPIQDEGGGEGRILAMATDVTDRRRAAEELRRSEARFRSVFESAGIGMVVVDAEDRCLMTNPIMPELLGYTPDELRGRRFTEFTHPDDVDADRALFQRLVAGERDAYAIEKRFRRKDGTVVWGRVTGTILGESENATPKVIRTVEDITARKRLEEERERLTAVLEATPDFVGTAGTDGRLLSLNRAGRRMVGLSATEDIAAYRISDLHPPWALSVILGEGIPAAIRAGSWAGETAMLTREGTEIPVSQVILAHPAPPAPVQFLSTIIRDLSERVQREGDERFLLEASRALGASLDEEETLGAVAKLVVEKRADFCLLDRLDANGAVTRTIAAHRDPALQPVLDELARFRTVPGASVGAAAALRTGACERVAEVTEAWLAAATVSEEHREVLRRLGLRSHLAVPIQTKGGVFALLEGGRTRPGWPFLPSDARLCEELARRAGVAVEHCRLYVESRQATHTRDEVLRVVAHDLRNPLSAIRLAATAVHESLPESMSVQRRQLELLERSVQLSNRLIEDLLDVARMEGGKLSVELATLDAAGIVAEAVELQRPLAQAKSIALEAAVAGSLPPIRADRGRLLQVFSNLIGNAVKFTPSGGRIGVRAEREGEFVRFSVVDSGPGIPQEARKHLFEPFWQARPGSMGAGLGLSLARGIVVAHGGTVEVESEVGVGSTFSFTIPLTPHGKLRLAG